MINNQILVKNVGQLVPFTQPMSWFGIKLCPNYLLQYTMIQYTVDEIYTKIIVNEASSGVVAILQNNNLFKYNNKSNSKHREKITFSCKCLRLMKKSKFQKNP